MALHLPINTVLPNKATAAKETSSEACTTTQFENPWSDANLERCRQLWNLLPDEIMQLKLLQAHLSDVRDSFENNPFDVVRFLRENKGNLKIAEKKFRSMLDWRHKHQVDCMLDPNEYRPPSLYRYFPAGVLEGVDKEGDPIHCERTGDADSSGLLSRYGRDEMLKQAIWIREIQSRGKWHQDYEKRQGHPIKQFTVVLDMKGLKARNMGPGLISVSQEVSRIVQDFYPYYAKRIIIIRAPALFQVAFNAIKPFLDESMRDKIVVSGGHRDHCKVLEKYMDLKVLPPEICPSGDGKAVADFPNVVWEGGKIPDHEEDLSLQQVVTLQADSVIGVEVAQAISGGTNVSDTDRPLAVTVGHVSKPLETFLSQGGTQSLDVSSEERRKRSNWVQRQLELFQATFSSFEAGDSSASYAI